MLVSRQKYGNEVKADIMLRGVVREMSASPTVNPLPTRFTSILPDSCPSYRQSLASPFACIYTLLPTNELYILSCFLALLIVDGRSDCPLGT